MSEKKPTILTAQQFAARKKIDYRTALNWLKAGIVPGAVERETPIGTYWEIPASAVEAVVPPKRGWTLGVKRSTKSKPSPKSKAEPKAAPQPTLFDAKPKKKAVKKS